MEPPKSPARLCGGFLFKSYRRANMKIAIKNWRKFQHYAHRNPPWIKLHKGLLDDYDFNMLQDASKVLAMKLWLLASEYQDGVIELSVRQIEYRMRSTYQDLKQSLDELEMGGFVTVFQDASEALAPCNCDATTEKSRVETEQSIAEKISAPIPPPDSRPKKVKFHETEQFKKYVDWFWDLYALENGRGRNGNKKKTIARLSKSITSEDQALIFAISVNEYLRQVDTENKNKSPDNARPLKLPEVLANEWEGYIPFDVEQRVQAHKARQINEQQKTV